jgi:TctA family transporter
MAEMFEAFAQGLVLVFSLKTFSLMLVGIAVGFVVGILPGLGGPVTLALMLPFIFKMQAVEAFAFLLGMSAVTATTGDITSILFGIPGEAITAATIVDGHPMAKKGEAGRALGAALMSSLIGAIFGALCLAVAVPIVRPLVLSIRSPEVFMLSMLGIAFLSSLSGEAVVKGLAAAAMGLMFATVGLDPISATERYTFGALYLWDGIRLVPATLGLFAIPEIIDLAVKGTSIAEASVGRLGGVMEGVKDTFRHWGLVIRCSALGAYIGVIPGMGGSISQWVAYAHAVQSSPNKERFGKGAVEGVLGPGAANNSTLGGALIPTVAFGVPGSVVTAILLGAFIIQGLVPGPPMLIPESQGGHLTLTFSLVWIVVVSNVITVAVCFLFLNQLAKITMVRASLVIPFVLLLVYLGGFAENNAFGDLIVVLFFGALGWIMAQLEWPRPPLILGLVLGRLAEKSLFLTTDNYGLSWLGFPSVLFLFALILAGTFYPLWQRRREQKREPLAGLEAAKEPKKENAPVSISELTLSSCVIALMAWGLWEARDWGFRPSLFPWTIGFPGLGLGIVQLFLDLRRFLKAKTVSLPHRPPEEAVALAMKQTAGISAWIVGYFLAIWLLGFYLAIPMTTLLYLKIAGKERWPTAIIATLLAWALFYALFDYALHIPFPKGLVLDWLKV